MPPAAVQQRIINVQEPLMHAGEARADGAGAPSPLPLLAVKTNTSDFDSSTLDKQLAAGDAQIADRLREQAKQLDKRFDIPAERKAVKLLRGAPIRADLGSRRPPAPANAKADDCPRTCKNAGADALDVSDYPVPDFAAASNADALACERHQARRTHMIAYARHLIGRPHRADARVRPKWTTAAAPSDPADILQEDRRQPRRQCRHQQLRAPA